MTVELPVSDHLTVTGQFRAAWNAMNSGGNLFLTGKAGTGKSTLVRLFLESTPGNTLVVAPTGIAALNVGGYTIHRLFGFPPGVTEQAVRGGRLRPWRFAKALKKLDTLVIDEISMVRADLFDALVTSLEMYGPKPGKPFGGVQLILVGDLHQLPPIVSTAERESLSARYQTPYFFSAETFSTQWFPTIELDEVFRQKGDGELLGILNAVREGQLDADALETLNARTDPGFEPSSADFWVTLAPTNRVVTARNSAMLGQLSSDPARFEAILTGNLDGFEKPVDTTLELAAGAQVMLLNNDPDDRWANGTLGRVVRIDGSEKEPNVVVELADGREVSVTRHRWDVTRPVLTPDGVHHEVVGSLEQLPLKLAWAVTVHKSQGQTLDRVVLDLAGGMFAEGQLYVALSRCTSLDGMVLKRPVMPRDLRTDPRVQAFLESGAGAGQGRTYASKPSVGYQQESLWG